MTDRHPTLYEARARAAKVDRLAQAAISVHMTADEAERASIRQRSMLAGIAQVLQPSDETWRQLCTLLRGAEKIAARMRDPFAAIHTGSTEMAPPGHCDEPWCPCNREHAAEGRQAYLDAVDGKVAR